jgi:hypothetical protein
MPNVNGIDFGYDPMGILDAIQMILVEGQREMDTGAEAPPMAGEMPPPSMMGPPMGEPPMGPPMMGPPMGGPPMGGPPMGGPPMGGPPMGGGPDLGY